MPAAPVPHPVDERLKAAITEISATREGWPHGRRTCALQQLVEEWDRIDPEDAQRWTAVEAVVLLDAEDYNEAAPAFGAAYSSIVELLCALMSLAGEMEGGVELVTMHRANQAFAAIAPIYAELETQILAYSLAKAQS